MADVLAFVSTPRVDVSRSRRRFARSLVPVLAIASTTLFACSSNSPGSVRSTALGTAQSGTSSSLGASTGTPTSGAASTGAPVIHQMTKDQLTAALLPLSAMPVGYSDDPNPDTTTTTKTFCNYRQPSKANISVSTTYIKGSGLSTSGIGPGIRQFDSPNAARRAFDALTHVMQTCRHDTDTDGTALTYAVVNMPQIAEGSIEIRIDGAGVTAFNAFALAGAALVNVGAGGLVASNEDLLPTLLANQASRYLAATGR